MVTKFPVNPDAVGQGLAENAVKNRAGNMLS
jgi:hypothetical protein